MQYTHWKRRGVIVIIFSCCSIFGVWKRKEKKNVSLFPISLSPKVFFVSRWAGTAVSFLFPSLCPASIFVIALNPGWLAAWFVARGGSVIMASHAGCADDGRNLSHLTAAGIGPSPPAWPPCCIPTRSSMLIIPPWATKCGSHHEACCLVTLPTLSVWKLGCACEALALITLCESAVMGKLFSLAWRHSFTQ